MFCKLIIAVSLILTVSAISESSDAPSKPQSPNITLLDSTADQSVGFGVKAEAYLKTLLDTLNTNCDYTDPDVRIISSTSELQSLNNSKARIFCLLPGDYRSAGIVKIQSSGSELMPRVLRLAEALPDKALNAVKLPMERQAILAGLKLSSARYWIIDGLAILNENTDPSLVNQTIQFINDSSNNLLSRSLVQGGRIAIRIHGSHRNTLLYNVVRRTVRSDGDSNCINIEGESGQTIFNNRILSNEVYDCTDSLQLVTLADSHGNLTFPGTLVVDNDFYLTPAMYTDCSGNVDPGGACSRAEGRFDIKGGGTGPGPHEQVVVTGNRIWGARQTDPVLGSTSWGSGIDLCCGKDIAHVRIEGNIIFSSDRGISIGGTNTHNISIVGNTLFDIGSTNWNSGQAMLTLSDTRNTRWSKNVIVNSERWGLFFGSNHSVQCNVVVESPLSVFDETVSSSGNYLYGTANSVNENDVWLPAVAEARNEKKCFLRKRITGPEEYCIPNALTTARSPHATPCSFHQP